MRLDALLAQELGVKKSVAEQLIRRGEVKILVDDKPVTSPAFQVLLGGADKVAVDGRELNLASSPRHFHRIILLHKPRGVVCMRSKPPQRDVYSAVPQHLRHSSLCTFGRLDRDTTGLYLLGTDGGLQALLLHPATKLPKTYLVGLDPKYPLSEDAAQRFREGLVLANGHRCDPSSLEVLERGFADEGNWNNPLPLTADTSLPTVPPATLVSVTVAEGKYHQVKKMIGCCGGFVASLHRESLGNLRLDPDELPEGECRALTLQELHLIKEGLPFRTRTAPAELEVERRKIIRERFVSCQQKMENSQMEKKRKQTISDVS